MSKELISTHEWDVHAPIERVFDTLADLRTYPAWWERVYLGVSADGEPKQGWRAIARIVSPAAIGGTEHQVEITRYERPRVLEMKYESSEFPKVRTWTLTDVGSAVHIKVETHTPPAGLMDELLSRMPGFRTQANFMMEIARRGLGPYLEKQAAPRS